MAADKTQNININYNFNTPQIERATSLMQRADQAAQKFQKSATAAGQGINSSFKSTGTSIETLRGKVELLREQIIRASDPKVVKRLSDEYKKLKTQLDAATKSAFSLKSAQDQVNKSTQTTVSGFDKASKSIGNLYSGVKLFLAAGLLRETVNTALEMATLSGRIDGVTRAFNKVPNSALVLDDLRQATKGTVTDLVLMQRALQAKNFQIPLQQLGKLFEFAGTKAQQTGQDVNHLIDYIVSGIGYRSIKRLDDLGFTANRVRDALGGVSLQAASMQQVMSAVTKLINEDLAATGGYAETTATNVEQLTAASEELWAVVSRKLTNGGWIKGATEGIKELAVVAEAFPLDKLKLLFIPFYGGAKVVDAWVDRYLELKRAADVTNEALNRTKNVQEQLNGTSQQNVDTLVKNLIANKQAIRTREQEISVLQAKNKLVDIEYEKGNIFVQQQVAMKGANDKMSKSLQFNVDVLKQVNTQLQQLIQTIQSDGGESADTLGLIAAKLEQIEAVGDNIKAAKTTREIHDLNNELAKLEGELADLKALGTTKQLLEVDGKLKLVPVTEPKDLLKYKVDVEDALGRLQTKMKVTLEFERPDSNTVLREMFDQNWQDGLRNNIPTPNPTSQSSAFQPDFWDKLGDEFSENWKDVLGQGLDDTANFFNSVIQSEADQYDARLNQAKAFYDRQMILAGDNENFKDRLRLREAKEEQKLRQQAFEADKRAKKSQAAINGAVAITNAFATLGPIAGAVAAITIAASTLAQIAAIDREKPRLAKGVLNIKGPGTATSDSIDAKLSRGESVMTAEETRKSFGILKSIRAKTLDDKVLEDLRINQHAGVYAGGMSDKRIVKELQSLRGSIPDYGEKYGVLWRTTNRSETYRKMVRAKTM